MNQSSRNRHINNQCSKIDSDRNELPIRNFQKNKDTNIRNYTDCFSTLSQEITENKDGEEIFQNTVNMNKIKFPVKTKNNISEVFDTQISRISIRNEVACQKLSKILTLCFVTFNN
jgi:hypothetical protein